MSRSPMVLAYLDAFFAVAETLSFSKAARRLSVSQPAISRQIRLLEEELGQALFVRDKQHVALTARGTALREGILRSYTELLSGIKVAKDDAQELSGSIRIGALRESGPFVELATTFQKRHPGIVFQFEFMDNFEIVSALREGHVDFGITTVAPDNESYQTFPLYTQDSIVVTRSSNARDIVDWAAEGEVPFVRYRFPTALHRDAESFFGTFVKSYRRELGKVRPKVVFAVNSHRSMAEVLAASDCYAVMPHYYVRKFLRFNKLRRVGDYMISKKIYLTQVYSPHVEARAKLFRHFLVEESRKIQRQ